MPRQALRSLVEKEAQEAVTNFCSVVENKEIQKIGVLLKSRAPILFLEEGV